MYVLQTKYCVQHKCKTSCCWYCPLSPETQPRPVGRGSKLVGKVWTFWEEHKIWKNLPLKIWHYWVTSNFKWNIFSNFVAFLEYPNFIYLHIFVLSISFLCSLRIRLSHFKAITTEKMYCIWPTWVLWNRLSLHLKCPSRSQPFLFTTYTKEHFDRARLSTSNSTIFLPKMCS